MQTIKMLDVCCGMGGASEGFAKEGFDVTGIDIEDAPNRLTYQYNFIQGDIKKLNGCDFRGFDVIWGSPPCRDFSQLGVMFGKKWRNPPNPENGIKTIRAFLNFVEEAKPTYWIMENVALCKKYFKDIKPRAETYITHGKRHVFYGNFPLFLIPRDARVKVRTFNKYGRTEPLWNDELRSWRAAKIPLPVSQAFARACKDGLEAKRIEPILLC